MKESISYIVEKLQLTNVIIGHFEAGHEHLQKDVFGIDDRYKECKKAWGHGGRSCEKKQMGKYSWVQKRRDEEIMGRLTTRTKPQLQEWGGGVWEAVTQRNV